MGENKVTTLQITYYLLHISLSENETIIPYLFVSGGHHTGSVKLGAAVVGGPDGGLLGAGQ